MIRDTPRASHDGEELRVSTELTAIFFKDRVQFAIETHGPGGAFVTTVTDPIKLAALRNRLSMWKNAKGYEKKDV